MMKSSDISKASNIVNEIVDMEHRVFRIDEYYKPKQTWWRSPDGVSVLTFFKYKCPCCEKRITDIDKFCPNCGQAIDWSNE